MAGANIHELRDLLISLATDELAYRAMLDQNRDDICKMWMGKQWECESAFKHLVPDPNMQLPPGF